MENGLTKEDISQMIEEVVSAKLPNQQVTITFNLEDFEAERKLKNMLDVSNYQTILFNFNEFFRKQLKYERGSKVEFKPIYSDEYKEIIPDLTTLEYVESIFHQFLKENKIDIDDLY